MRDNDDNETVAAFDLLVPGEKNNQFNFYFLFFLRCLVLLQESGSS